MRIIFKGTYRKCSEKVLREAVRFAAKELIPKEILKTLRIKVILKKDIPFYAEMMPNFISGSYTIWVANTMTPRWVIASIFHELTHVKQYVTGEMKDLNKEGSLLIWNSSIVKYDDDDPLKRDYYRAPWEVEAYGRETTLWELWKRRKAIEKAEREALVSSDPI